MLSIKIKNFRKIFFTDLQKSTLKKSNTFFLNKPIELNGEDSTCSNQAIGVGMLFRR
jgi:hypothetical protein